MRGTSGHSSPCSPSTGDCPGWSRRTADRTASGCAGLLALSLAGSVPFLGAGIRIGTDETTGTFTATSPTAPGHTVHAPALIEAYLPGASLGRIEDPLLRDPHRTGTLTEEVIADAAHTHRSGLLTVPHRERTSSII